MMQRRFKSRRLVLLHCCGIAVAVMVVVSVVVVVVSAVAASVLDWSFRPCGGRCPSVAVSIVSVVVSGTGAEVVIAFVAVGGASFDRRLRSCGVSCWAACPRCLRLCASFSSLALLRIVCARCDYSAVLFCRWCVPMPR